MPYCRPFNYPKYVKDSNLDVCVAIFEATIKAIGEIKDAKIVKLFNFTLKGIVLDWCNK
jgi:hypothetical protein